MTRLPILTLILGSFLAGAALMFTGPQFIGDAHAGKAKKKAVAFVAPPIREGSNPTKWEYYRNGGNADEMQALGEQGWELIAINNFVYVFKRELP